MENFWFYLKLGLEHVLDFAAYDHILFLSALAIPFTFTYWKRVLVLATFFTVAHCLSLVLAVYGIVTMDVGLIEFLIPVTILMTAFFDLFYRKKEMGNRRFYLHSLTTAFFGLIHGFGFSNYFKILMDGEDEKVVPMIGFATGIELSQVLIILGILLLAYLFQSVFGLKKPLFILVASIIVISITIPILVETFPW